MTNLFDFTSQELLTFSRSTTVESTKEKRTYHIEVNDDTHWALVSIAAKQKLHQEDFVENLLVEFQALHAIYDLGVERGQAGSQEVAEPAPVAGGLVERISYEIRIGRTTLKSDEVTAVHTILEVARWLRSELVSREIAERLEQEAGR